VLEAGGVVVLWAIDTANRQYGYYFAGPTTFVWLCLLIWWFSTTIRHYTLTAEDPRYQGMLRAAVSAKVVGVKALNLQLTAFAADILRVAKDYTATMAKDPTLQSKCEGAYPNIRVQQLKSL